MKHGALSPLVHIFWGQQARIWAWVDLQNLCMQEAICQARSTRLFTDLATPVCELGRAT